MSTIIALTSAAAVHLVVSAFVAYVASTYRVRIFDVREFPNGGDYPSLVGGYLQSVGTSGKTVVAGSSFSFGYPFSAELAFPPRVAGATLNVSVIGASLQGVYSYTLCEMKRRRFRASRIVVEIPLINETASLNKRTGGWGECEISDRSRTLFHYALTNINGLLWIERLRDRYRSSKRSRPISIKPVPDHYFATREEFTGLRDRLRQGIERAYELATEVSDQAFLFVTPVYIPGVSEAGRDAENVRDQFLFAEAACMEIAGQNCILTHEMLDESDHYSNLTHLRPEGAAHLAKLITRGIAAERLGSRQAPE